MRSLLGFSSCDSRDFHCSLSCWWAESLCVRVFINVTAFQEFLLSLLTDLDCDGRRFWIVIMQDASTLWPLTMYIRCTYNIYKCVHPVMEAERVTRVQIRKRKQLNMWLDIQYVYYPIGFDFFTFWFLLPVTAKKYLNISGPWGIF